LAARMVVIAIAGMMNAGPSKSSFDIAGDSAAGAGRGRERRRPVLAIIWRHASESAMARQKDPGRRGTAVSDATAVRG
jgi:hypothetical protein